MQCLTYLAVYHRLREETDKSEQYALQGRESAQAAQLRVYEGAALANLAWVELQRGDFRRSEELGQRAWR